MLLTHCCLQSAACILVSFCSLRGRASCVCCVCVHICADEREAIQAVLDSSEEPKSPLTREVLTQSLVPNRNLRRRIEEHESEVDAMVEKVEASQAAAVAEAAAMAESASSAVAAAEAENAALREQLRRLQAAQPQAVQPLAGEGRRSRRRGS